MTSNDDHVYQYILRGHILYSERLLLAGRRIRFISFNVLSGGSSCSVGGLLLRSSPQQVQSDLRRMQTALQPDGCLSNHTAIFIYLFFYNKIKKKNQELIYREHLF